MKTIDSPARRARRRFSEPPRCPWCPALKGAPLAAVLAAVLAASPLRAAYPEAAALVPLRLRLGASVEALAGVGSRVTGYPGSARAADWLAAQLRTLGATELYTQAFTVPVPVDEGFILEAGGRRLSLYGVWPNLVRTPTLPPQGLSGVLVDGGDDVLTRLDGQPVRDRIVLLDEASGTAWVDAMRLGARAVIFLGGVPAHRAEAVHKFLAVPADFPRLYATANVAGTLRQLARDGADVRLRGRMPWRPLTGHNLVGVIPGRDPALRHEAVVVGAHYDAMSPVPALAPGAEQAASAAALLELARAWAAHPPGRTVILVLTDGHYLQLAGMRAFTPLLLDAAGRRELAVSAADSALLRRLTDFELRLFIGLDLSSGADIVQAAKPVSPYRTSLLAPPLHERLMALGAAYEDSALGGRRLLANGLRQDLTRQGLGGLPYTLPVDAAVAALAGCPALVFQTLNDGRPRIDSPADLPGAVDGARLARQADLLRHVLPRLADDPDMEAWAWGNDAFGRVHGQVVHYGPRSYLPDEPTAGALVRLRLRNPTLAGVRPDVWAVADTAGRFAIPGVETGLIYTQPVRLEAYGIDAATGAVTDAPDWGVNGERRLPRRALMLQMDDLDEEVQIVTAPMRGRTLVSLFDPRNLHTPERPLVIDARTEAEPPIYGACMPLTAPEMELFGYKNRVGSWVEPAATIFAPAGARLKIALATGVYGLGRRLLLLDADADDAAGRGYVIGGGDGILDEVGYRVAGDLHALDGERIGNLQRHGVRNARLAADHERAGRWLAAATTARQAHRHRRFLEAARRAWAHAISAYRDVQGTQGGVLQGALFLLALLLPFAHFAERLLFGFADVRWQVGAYFALFLAGFLALSHLHPAFELSISPVVILLGFVILSLGLLVTAIGLSRLNRELQAMAQGPRQRAGMRRGGAMMTAIVVGLANLRRRPLRTGLTCATLILLTFSILSFTSIQARQRANWIDAGRAAPYGGALVRLRGWETLEIGAYEALRDRFGAGRVAPRAWLSVASLAASIRLEADDDPGRSAAILGLSGLSARESGLVAPDQGLVAGRWLGRGEADACVLPVGVARELGIEAREVAVAGPGDGGQGDGELPRVRVFGEVFRVVGLLDDTALDRVDLNGEPLTPLDPEAQKPTEAQVGAERSGTTAVYTHLPAARVAVLPWTAVLRWEQGRLASIGIRQAAGVEAPAARAELDRLSATLDLDLFVGWRGSRWLVNTVDVSSVSGLGALTVPVLIAALVVLNTMIGAVYERTGEIGTFNAIGLAPSHVSGLFMAEAVALAVVSATLGYLLGQAAAQGMAHLGLLPGLELNYSSLAAVVTVGLVICLVVLSAIYPARMAGRICTPGIERRWRPPAPEGSRLRMVLPFTLIQRDAAGMAAFQAEFWASHREQSIGAGFYVEALEVRRVDTAAGEGLQIRARTWLAPFDQGVVQEVTLTLAPGEDPRYHEIEVCLDLATGDLATWGRVSRTFLDDLRKQFLLWRALSPEDRDGYRQQLQTWLSADAAGVPV